ncbi:MAG: hypothetical protein ACREJC_13420, partial [Tepidisphaeraceae bacterium]
DDGSAFYGYHGAWNNYPFFPSGNVIVSDIDGGLFVLRPDISNIPDPNPIGPGGGYELLSANMPEPGGITALTVVGALAVVRRRR